MPEPITCKQMNSYIGREGSFVADGFMIRVKILDARSNRPDTMDFLIVPVSGQNKRWVSSTLVGLDNEE